MFTFLERVYWGISYKGKNKDVRRKTPKRCWKKTSESKSGERHQ